MAKTYYFEKFSSISDYVNTIASRPSTSLFSGYQLTSEKLSKSASFHGTQSYKASLELLRTGYEKGLNDLNNAKNVKINQTRRQSKNLPCSAPVGYAPIVANALQGLPNSMVYHKTVSFKAKVVTIWYDIAASCKVTPEEMTKAGRNILDLVMMLEGQGYRVELCAATIISTKKEVVGSIVRLKTDRQPMNPLKISYPILHASFLRRQGLKWLEGCDKITDASFPTGYGHPFSLDFSTSDERRNALRSQKVLPDNCFYTDFYEAKNNTPEALSKLMGLR